MKLYKIERTTKIDYDEYDSFVIRAKNEQHARKLAKQANGIHSLADEWLDPATSTVEVLTPKGEAGIILGSFNAG